MTAAAIIRHISRGASEESGFTLIELLVVLVSAVVITGALFTMLDVTLHQSTRTFSKVSAAQAARTGMADIENELHSACLTADTNPIVAGSDANDLVFVSQYGNTTSAASAAVPTPVEHKITFSSTTNTLTDSVYAVNGGTSPDWTFNTTPTSTVTLMSNVTAVGSTPVFQYFEYSPPMNGATPYTDSAGNTYMMIQDGLNYVPGTTIQPAAAPLTTPISTTDAENAAEVLVTLSVGPAGGTMLESNLGNVSTQLQDQVVLRLTPPANHAGGGATFLPCA